MKSSLEQVTTMSKSLIGAVFDIKRFAVHDGSGIRTTVFMKGCPLRCVWCQNPEGLNKQRQILYLANKCIKCQSCVQKAVNKGIIFSDDKIQLQRNCEEDWEKIIDICPTRALQYDSELYTVDELIKELLKDEAFFKYDGGVTISGGEPLLQHEFTLAVLKACKQYGIHTAIESSLYVSQEILVEFLPYVDQIFADMKIFDNELHHKYTNVDNKIIKNNLKFLLNNTKKDDIIIRTPLIPKMTATQENIAQIARFLSDCYSDVHYELLNYNPLAKAKYNYLDLKYCFEENPKLYSSTQMQMFYRIARQNGIKNLIIE